MNQIFQSNCSPGLAWTKYKVFTSNLGIFPLNKSSCSRPQWEEEVPVISLLYILIMKLLHPSCLISSHVPASPVIIMGGLIPASLHSTAPPLFSVIGWDTDDWLREDGRTHRTQEIWKNTVNQTTLNTLIGSQCRTHGWACSEELAQGLWVCTRTMIMIISFIDVATILKGAGSSLH